MTIEELVQDLYQYIDLKVEEIRQQLFYNPGAASSVELDEFESLVMEEYSGYEFIRHETLRALVKLLSSMQIGQTGIMQGIIQTVEALNATDAPGAYTVELSDAHSPLGFTRAALLCLPADRTGNVKQIIYYNEGAENFCAIRSGYQLTWGAWFIVGEDKVSISSPDYMRSDTLNLSSITGVDDVILPGVYGVILSSAWNSKTTYTLSVERSGSSLFQTLTDQDGKSYRRVSTDIGETWSGYVPDSPISDTEKTRIGNLPLHTTQSLANEAVARQAGDDQLLLLINALSNGSPRGVFANRAALVVANPSYDYTYVTQDDGKWNYWDPIAEEWAVGGDYQIALSTSGVRSQSTVEVPQMKLLDDSLTELENTIGYRNFTDKETGNRFIKEAYLSGALNPDKIYYLDLITRQDATYNNGFFIKEADPGFLNDTVIMSVLYKTEEELSGIITAKNTGETITLKMIVDWEAVQVGVNTGETLKCVFQPIALEAKNSPYIYAKENLDELNQTVEDYLLSNGEMTYATPESGDSVYSNPSVSMIGVYRQLESQALINEISLFAAAPSSGYAMQIRVCKSESKPVFSNIPDEAFTLVYSGASVWDDNENNLKKVRIPSTSFAAGEYLIILMATYADLGPKMRNYTTDTTGRQGFIYSTSSNYTGVFGEMIAVAADESTFSQAMPGIAHVSDSANIEQLENDIASLQSGKADKVLPRITLPSVIYAAVGTQLNIYYDAITLGLPGAFSVEVLTDIGSTFERMYQVTPTSGQTGDHALTINVYSAGKVLLQTKSVILRVIAASAPSAVKNILLIGDSTLNNGPVSPTIRANFVALGSNTPLFRGGKGVSPAQHQGWPGASAENYATAATGDSRYEFTVTGATGLEQDAFYTNNGSTFVIQDIYTSAGVGKIRAYRYAGTNAPSTSGVLVKTDGVGPGTIPFSAVAVVSANPLWNTSTGALDVANYRSLLSMGSSKFDIVTIRLGVNESFGELKTEENRLAVIEHFKAIIGAFVADNSATKFIIELPTTCGNTKSGWGVNYGATGRRETYEANVWRVRELLITTFDNGAYSANVEVCATGGMVDRYYGFERTTVQIASRITETEERHTNAVHPTTGGYYQLADGLFPHILKFIQ